MILKFSDARDFCDKHDIAMRLNAHGRMLIKQKPFHGVLLEVIPDAGRYAAPRRRSIEPKAWEGRK